MIATQLVLPHIKYKSSFIEAVKEYQLEGLHTYTKLDINLLNQNFSSYLTKLKEKSVGVNLLPENVPYSTFWLVEDLTFIGRVKIRHILNARLRNEGGHIGYDIRPSKRRVGYGTVVLQLGLQKAKKIGLDEVLITCNIDNIGSNKIIITNGGVLTRNRANLNKNYYWITLP